jgi:hypothetical protein
MLLLHILILITTASTVIMLAMMMMMMMILSIPFLQSSAASRRRAGRFRRTAGPWGTGCRVCAMMRYNGYQPRMGWDGRESKTWVW